MAKKIVMQLTQEDVDSPWLELTLLPVVERTINTHARKNVPVSATTIAEDALGRVNSDKTLSATATNELYGLLKNLADRRLRERWG